MTSPIDEARASVPFWMKEIQTCDGLEIHPVRDQNWNDAEQGPRPFVQTGDNETHCEPCQPHEAHFWSVYGHLKEGGILCFEDFASETEAEAFARKLYAAYPHLRGDPPRPRPPAEAWLFYALPYDISANGFYFRSREEYQARRLMARGDSGLPAEEFEIQFIDGETLDAYFADAFGINQANVFRFIELAEEWDEHGKRRFMIAVGECGYSFDPDTVDPDDFDVDIYEVGSLRELAEQFVDDGLFGEIPENIQNYLDYDAIARDLAADYSETTIAGTRLVYRCG
jgi:antirestriction protein